MSKFLLRSGQRPTTGVRPWTRPYLIWVAQLRFKQSAQEFTRQDYLHEVEHMRERVSPATLHLVWLAEAAREHFGRGQGNRVESATPPAQAVYEARCGRQAPGKD